MVSCVGRLIQCPLPNIPCLVFQGCPFLCDPILEFSETNIVEQVFHSGFVPLSAFTIAVEHADNGLNEWNNTLFFNEFTHGLGRKRLCSQATTQ